MPKILFNYKVIKAIFIFFSGAIIGSYVVYKLKKNTVIEKVKIEKIADNQAILDAVKKEREEIFKTIRQVKFKKTVKKIDGETTITEKIKTDANLSKLTNNDLSFNLKERNHFKEITNKETLDCFNFALFTGSEIDFKNFRTLEDYNFKAYAGIKIIYNITPNLSTQFKYSYEITQNSHSISGEIVQKF